MKRVFEFIPSDHEVIVSRLLVLVHQAVDAELPSATPPSSRFAKTAFGEEPTLTQTMPSASVDEAKKLPPSPDEHTEESLDMSSNMPGADQDKPWKQSIIAVVFLLICALLFYILLRPME